MVSNLKGLQFPVLLFFTSLMMACGWCYTLVGGQITILELELLNISRTNFSIILIVDKINLSFSMVVTLIAGRVFTFAHKYIEEDHYRDRFLWILMAFVIRMNLLTFSGSIFFLLLG